MFYLDLRNIVGSLISGFMIYLLWHWLSRKRYPPGPWGLPILGHLSLLGNRPEIKYLQWWKRYGDIVRIRFGSWNTVVINGYEAIKDASERKDDAFSGRPDFVTQVALREALDGLEVVTFANFSQKYLQLRKLIATALRIYTTKCEYPPEDLFQDEAQKLAEKLLRHSGEKSVCLMSDVELATQSVIYQMLYGRGKEHEITPYVSRIVEANNTFNKFVGQGNMVDVVPWLRYFMKGKVEQFKKAFLAADWITRDNMKEHKKSFQKGQIRDVLDGLCGLSNDLPETQKVDNVSGFQLMYQVLTLQGAGFDTSSRTMLFLILYMIAYPDVQERVQEEIDGLLGSSKIVSWKDRGNLPYVNATIQEVMRKTSLVPFALPHYTIHDTKLHGYDIDQHTVVLFNLHSVANEKSFWGDPENFRPERLLDENGKLDAEKCSHILSFSAGRRRCAGELLAKMIIFIMFTTVMQRCIFQKVDGCDLDLEPFRSLVFSPKPFKVVVGSRQ